ncbi:MAG: hypothetical protein HDQ98_04730 [Lachnospiraceae bacterium]|nr:hypothetical protein [Lachnospiraceae bacterium]
MELNLFFEGVDSCHGFQSEMLRRVDQVLPIHTCVITTKCSDGKDVYEDKYTCVNYDVCEHNRYDEFYDLNALLPLSRELLEAMVPYESTAMQMLVRNFERHLYTMDESKRFYLDHLRFWNHMIVTKRINYICFSNIPHHCHDYVIYALGRVYGIPMSFCSDTSIPPRLAYCTDMENMWENTYRKYLSYREEKEITLPEDLEHYYQALLHKNQGLDDKAVHRGMTKKDHIAVRREFFMSYFQRKNVWRRHVSWLKHGIKVSLTEKSMEGIRDGLKKLRQDKVYLKRGRIKLKSMRDVHYYDNLADRPSADETEPFVIFFLHLQPEATTLPKGGVFVEQELMIGILAAALVKFGVKLYVKEHFVQPYRNKDFYDRLAKIPNVRLIRSDVDSKELVKRCMATASCNGTVLLESMFNGIPTFIFGDTPFRGGPGVYYVGSVEECETVMQDILDGKVSISAHDVRAELKAFGDSSFLGYFDASNYEKKGVLTEEEGLAGYVDYVTRCVREQLDAAERCTWEIGKRSG